MKVWVSVQRDNNCMSFLTSERNTETFFAKLTIIASSPKSSIWSFNLRSTKKGSSVNLCGTPQSMFLFERILLNTVLAPSNNVQTKYKFCYECQFYVIILKESCSYWCQKLCRYLVILIVWNWNHYHKNSYVIYCSWQYLLNIGSE